VNRPSPKKGASANIRILYHATFPKL